MAYVADVEELTGRGTFSPEVVLLGANKDYGCDGDDQLQGDYDYGVDVLLFDRCKPKHAWGLSDIFT